ncbi:hypothetical protein AVEN_17838-1 [Araneus ventricosus]|uniref:Uncharacterized protein n=1 Tax=Araneus ventricosus TaxID=182803 RepID=A0A4Y2QRA9_ARAVE|nr:hypothetical protein AVEN_17838-1 [Araneus ventricosus]
MLCKYGSLSSPNRKKGRGGLVVRPRLGAGGFQIRHPIPLKIRRVWGPLHAKSYVAAKRSPAAVARKFGEGVPAQVSSSSSDRGSNLRGPSQNSPRVASKRDVNITKLNQIGEGMIDFVFYRLPPPPPFS